MKLNIFSFLFAFLMIKTSFIFKINRKTILQRKQIEQMCTSCLNMGIFFANFQIHDCFTAHFFYHIFLQYEHNDKQNISYCTGNRKYHRIHELFKNTMNTQLSSQLCGACAQFFFTLLFTFRKSIQSTCHNDLTSLDCRCVFFF